MSPARIQGEVAFPQGLGGGFQGLRFLNPNSYPYLRAGRT